MTGAGLDLAGPTTGKVGAIPVRPNDRSHQIGAELAETPDEGSAASTELARVLRRSVPFLLDAVIHLELNGMSSLHEPGHFFLLEFEIAVDGIV